MSDNEISIIVTGAGAPGITGTLYSIRNNPDQRKFRIICTDINKNASGKYLADAFYTVPPPEDENYLESLKEIVSKENVSIIIPQTTREIKFLSKFRGEFKELDCEVMVSNYDSIRKTNDKYNILLEANKVDVPVPEFILADSSAKFFRAIEELGYPRKNVVVKPRFSNGMRGVRILTTEKPTLKDFLENKPNGMHVDVSFFKNLFRGVTKIPEMLITEYLPGIEYSVDVLRIDQKSIVIPRTRVSIRSGISFNTEINLNKKNLITWSKKLARSAGLEYCVGFQYKLDVNDTPKILEANPRIQGTMVASTFAGCNMIYYAIKNILGEKVNTDNVQIFDKTTFQRVWGGIGIADGNYKGSL